MLHCVKVSKSINFLVMLYLKFTQNFSCFCEWKFYLINSIAFFPYDIGFDSRIKKCSYILQILRESWILIQRFSIRKTFTLNWVIELFILLRIMGRRDVHIWLGWTTEYLWVELPIFLYVGTDVNSCYTQLFLTIKYCWLSLRNVI